MVLLSLPSKYGDYTHMPPCLTSFFFSFSLILMLGNESRVLPPPKHWPAQLWVSRWWRILGVFVTGSTSQMLEWSASVPVWLQPQFLQNSPPAQDGHHYTPANRTNRGAPSKDQRCRHNLLSHSNPHAHIGAPSLLTLSSGQIRNWSAREWTGAPSRNRSQELDVDPLWRCYC